MTWWQLKINTTVSFAEEIYLLLESRGSLAITTEDAKDQPLYEPKPGATPSWDHLIITGLFETKTAALAILADIEANFSHSHATVSALADQNWEKAWMDDFKPMQFGERLWIIPSYETIDPGPQQVILDPGLAFGTGKHPTTALCLQWLDKNITGGEVLIDYGCGSGILAIAALKLGAAKVYAIDYDPQAISATMENAEKNHIPLEKIITQLPEQFSGTKADILIANILANPLIELAPYFTEQVIPGGKLVLSGILTEQADHVTFAYQPQFEVVNIAQLEEWVRIDAVRK